MGAATSERTDGPGPTSAALAAASKRSAPSDASNKPMVPTAPNQPEERSPDTWRRHIGQPLGSFDGHRSDGLNTRPEVRAAEVERGDQTRQAMITGPESPIVIALAGRRQLLTPLAILLVGACVKQTPRAQSTSLAHPSPLVTTFPHDSATPDVSTSSSDRTGPASAPGQQPLLQLPHPSDAGPRGIVSAAVVPEHDSNFWFNSNGVMHPRRLVALPGPTVDAGVND
jgi:hypothetical protein